MPELKNPRREFFCREYFKDFNSMAAYRRAGYKTKNDNVAAVSSHQLLRKPDIVARLKELQADFSAKCGMTEEEWTKKVQALVDSNVQDYLEATEDGVTMIPTKEMTREKAWAIKSIKHKTTNSGDSLEYEFHDKYKGLELLGRKMGILRDKVEVDFSDDSKARQKAWERRKNMNANTKA